MKNNFSVLIWNMEGLGEKRRRDLTKKVAIGKGDLMDYSKFILRDPQVCGGEPVIAGTRVTLRTVLASLAEGAGIGEILSDFPALTEEQVMAVIAFAAASAEEDLPIPGIPKVA